MKHRAIKFGLLASLLAYLSAAGGHANADATQQLTDDEKWAAVDRLTRSDTPVVTYRANFDQEKLSPLLRDPIRSSGRVRIAAEVSRWDTDPPNPSVMLMRDGEMRIYYPQQATLEVYELDNPKFRMAMSPTPDFAFLREHFSIEEMTPLGESGLRLVLLPDDEGFAQAIEAVEVAVDPSRGGMQMIAVTDIDGETTTLRFRDIELNPDLAAADLELAVPRDTKIVRPLDAVER